MSKDLHFIRRQASGPKLLFIHGNTGSANWWIPCMESMNGEYDMLALDMAGFGESPDPAGTVTIDGHARDILQLVQNQQFTPFVLIGHSLGGPVVMKFIEMYPELVRGVVFLSSARGIGKVKSRLALHFKKMLLSFRTVREKALKKLLVQQVRNKEFWDQLVKDCGRAVPSIIPNTMALDGIDFSQNGGKFTKPVLVIHGAKDPLIPVNQARHLAAAYPNSQFTLIEGVGHCPQTENTQEFSRLVRDFVAAL